MTHRESTLDRDRYRCSGGALAISHGTAFGDRPALYLARDKQRGLVAERVERVSGSIKLDAQAPAVALGHPTNTSRAGHACGRPVRRQPLSERQTAIDHVEALSAHADLTHDNTRAPHPA